jgi:hypothetical protein
LIDIRRRYVNIVGRARCRTLQAASD